MKKKRILITTSLLVLAVIVYLRSYPSITGTVVDAETGMSIEGAVVLVEWTITCGLPGLMHTNLYKVEELITSKEGVFKLSGVVNPFINSPRITVYKKGYVAWNNEYIFPSWHPRENFKWSNGIKIDMQTYRSEYSRSDHVYFLRGVTHWGRLIQDSFRWEETAKENAK